MARSAAKPASQRSLRVGEEVRHALAEVLERGHLRDPALAGVPVTVTEVRMSPDLKLATVFVMPLGGEHAPAVVEALNHARSFLRREVARAVRLKFVPDLRFRADASFAEAERIETLLRDPAVARDLAEEMDAGEEDEDTNHGH